MGNEPSIDLPAFRRAVELNPNSGPAHSALGIALARSGDPAGAAVAFRRAIELTPNGPDVYLHYGNALLALGRYAEEIGRAHV